MSKVRLGRVLAVFAIVFVIGQLAMPAAYFLFPGLLSAGEFEPPLEGMSAAEIVSGLLSLIWAFFPGPVIPIILVSAFAMNRIRSLFMIALAAAATLLFVAWGTLRGGAAWISLGFIDSMSELLKKTFASPLPDDLQIGLFYAIMAFVLFGVSFLIIKLVAAAEKRFATGRAEAA